MMQYRKYFELKGKGGKKTKKGKRWMLSIRLLIAEIKNIIINIINI